MADRVWIAGEFSKGIEAEHSLALEARHRADSPPDPALAVLYHQIAEDDERHRTILEAIAVRYGHTPQRLPAGGIGETISRLKDKVTEIGATAIRRVSEDLTAKANAIHWMVAWIDAFESISDTESARELAAILTEERSHHEALQQALSRLVTQGAESGEPASKG